MKIANKIRVRFAPSPTGYMHVGNFRTALYDYLFAKKTGGDFILRVEDTDKKRFIPDALEKLINIMNWAGLDYVEGVYSEDGEFIQKGDFGPYIQSERLDIYQKYAKQLIESGKAYYCFCAPERLEEMRNEQIAKKQAPMYDRNCLKLSSEEVEKKIKAGEKYVIRQKIDTEGFTEYEDLIRGKVKIKNDLLDDQVLLKSDGYPTYNFANVVDDNLMQISHIIRGEEYVSSTPKYIQLYQNFGWNIPKFAHLPLLLNPDKTKLSKRQGDVSVEDYIKKGYLKEAIINFVALLGWNPGAGETQEIFTLEELIQKFDLEKVHKAGAVFDLKKLDWINSQWIKKLQQERPAELYRRAKSFYMEKEFVKSIFPEKMKDNYLIKVLEVESDRLANLSGAGENNKFFFQDIDYDKELLKWKNMSDDKLRYSLQSSREVLQSIDDAKWEEKLDIFFNAMQTKLNNKLSPTESGNVINITQQKELPRKTEDLKTGELYWPLRVALSGEQKSPSPIEIAWVLGKNESLKRIEKALSL
ncbi:TPA: glutamate--tRNA ligase [Candidatus Moranbacteria bacterium]|nr:glutamate--tRNA ligase [Candidatus Moranbacteria bacterium]